MIHETDVPSVQYEVRCRLFNSIREVDGPIHDPPPTPRLKRSDAAPQISAKISLYEICGMYSSVISKIGQIFTSCLGVSFIYILGTGRNAEAPLLVFLEAWTFRFREKL